MIKALINLLAISFIFANPLLKSQEGIYNSNLNSAESKIYTLDECIKIALEKNPDYKLATQKINISNAYLRTMKGQYFPSADFSASYNRQLINFDAETMSFMGQVFQIPGQEPNSFSTGISVNYNLFDGFNRSNNYKKAELNLHSTEYNAKAFKNSIIYNVQKSYIDVITKMQEIAIQNENLILGKNQLEDIQAKFEAGVTHIGTVASQEADLANREFAIVQAQAGMNNSKLNLLNLMGLPLDTKMDLSIASINLSTDTNDMKRIIEKYSDTEKNFNDAISQRYDIQAYSNAIEASKLSLESSYSGYYPRLSANAGWNWSNSKLEKFNELSRAYVGASLSIPIFDQFNTSYQIENAKYEILQNEAELFKLKQNIQNSISISLENIKLAYKQLEISDRALAASQKNYDIARERFNVGNASITDMITANNALVLSKINRNSAFYNFFLAQKDIEFQISSNTNY